MDSSVDAEDAIDFRPWLIAAVIGCEMLCMSMVYPVLPKLLAAVTTTSEREASQLGALFSMEFGLLQFAFGPLMGSLSDRIGRRPVFLFSFGAFGINYLLLALAPDAGWFTIGYAIAGITGAGYTAGFAYIADVTPPKGRVRAFGQVSAGMALGVVLGPIIGGLLGAIDLRLPFLVAAALILFLATAVWLFLPESLPASRRQETPLSFSTVNPLTSLSGLALSGRALRFFIALVLISFAARGMIMLWPYYTVYRYNWTTAEIGYSLALSGTLTFLAQGVFVGRLVNVIGQTRTMLLGLGLYAVGWLGSGMAASSLVLYLFIVPTALGGLVDPCLRGALSRAVDEHQQGKLQGVISSATALISALSPFVFSWVFLNFTDSQGWNLVGAPFVLSAILALVAALVVLQSNRAAAIES